MGRFVFIIILLALTLNNIQAFSATYDQDSNLGIVGLDSLNHDKNYTMGLGFSFTNPMIDGSKTYWPIRKLDSIGMLHIPIFYTKGETKKLLSTTTIMSTNFTPHNIRDSNPIFSDRPYSSLIYFGTEDKYLSKDGRTLYTSEIRYGLLGLPLGKAVQIGIHDAQNFNDTQRPHTPRGWDNQISNGGEPTFLIRNQREYFILKNRIIDMKFGGQSLIGYYTGISLIFSGRVGWLNNEMAYFDPGTKHDSPFIKAEPKRLKAILKCNNCDSTSNNPDSTASSKYDASDEVNSDDNSKKDTVLEETTKTGLIMPTRKFEIFGFYKVEPYALLYNALLNGQLRESQVRISFGEMQHFLINAEIGAAFNLWNYAMLSYSVGYKSPELFHGENDPHFWGNLTMNFVDF